MSTFLPEPVLPDWLKLLNSYDPAHYIPGKQITAEEWNTLFLASVNQGNYLANTLDKLIKEYLPETFIAAIDFNNHIVTINNTIQALHEQIVDTQNSIMTAQATAETAKQIAQTALNTINYDTLPILVRVGV